MASAEKSIAELWQDYLFLTQEINKFLGRQDNDMFLELLTQRERLQEMIEEQQKSSFDFLKSQQGQQISAEIVILNHQMADKVHYTLNMEQKNQNISRAYEGLGDSAVGVRMDWKS